MGRYVIYMHKNKINGKVYIGQTCQNPPEKRWANGKGYSHNPYFTEAIEKYGFIYGWYLAIKRILRCNPFGKTGYDPVPCKHFDKK